MIEIVASAVVVWELSDASQRRRQRALVLIRTGFAGLAGYLVVQSTWALVVGHHARRSVGEWRGRR